MTVAAIEERLPTLVEARDVVENVHEMLRRKSKDDLEVWIDRAAKAWSRRGPERNNFNLVERPN